jgi:excisionase family DNA binding protein
LPHTDRETAETCPVSPAEAPLGVTTRVHICRFELRLGRLIDRITDMETSVTPSTSSAIPANGDPHGETTAAEQNELAERVRRGLPVELTADEQVRAQNLVHALRSGQWMIDAEGKRSELPAALQQIFMRATEVLARGDAVSLVPTDKLLSTQEAAEILNVSRQYLVRLLDSGKIAQTRTGTHRRVALGDVLKFKEKRDSERKAGLRELTKMSIDAGGYKELKRFR